MHKALETEMGSDSEKYSLCKEHRQSTHAFTINLGDNL